MKTVTVFTESNSQAVLLPQEFRVTDDELIIKKSGDSIVLTPKGKVRWKNVRAGFAMYRGAIEREQPSQRSESRELVCEIESSDG